MDNNCHIPDLVQAFSNVDARNSFHCFEIDELCAQVFVMLSFNQVFFFRSDIQAKVHDLI